jgi:hypothetical protein
MSGAMEVPPNAPLINTRLQPGVSGRFRFEPLQRFSRGEKKRLKPLDILSAFNTRLKPGVNERAAGYRRPT